MTARYEDGTDDYRMPDAAGNVFRSRDRRDRENGKGGRILRDRYYDYLYDVEGNLIQKTPRRGLTQHCLLYTSPSPRDRSVSRMPSSA